MPRRAKEPVEPRHPQLRVPLDQELHTALKVRAAMEHTTVRGLVTRILREVLDGKQR